MYYFVFLKRRKTMAGCALLVCATLLLLTMAVRRNHAEDNAPEQYYVNSYNCVNNTTCINKKILSTEKENTGLDGSFDVCHLTCGSYGSLWPRPTISTAIGKSVTEFGLDNVKFDTSLVADQLSKEYLAEASQVFISSLKKLCIPNCVSNANTPIISISTSTPFDYIKLTTNESYTLKITVEGNQILVKIYAFSVYGARHGLETVRQLIVTYGSNTSGKKLVIAGDVEIKDGPIFPHRGITLDTARHYFSIATIKRTIDAMGHSKLNVFHWHATDSHSFPLDLPNAPQMSKYGAYSSEQKYPYEEIKGLVRYALVRGIRIIFEIDSPGHAGYGWQWGKESGYGNLAVCVGKAPWTRYCVQPPCGQLNPINTNTYKWLGKIYKDLISLVPKGEAFHMGGDEVAINCWNSTSEIVDWMRTNNQSLDMNGYLELWSRFHSNALSEYDKEAGDSNSNMIVWSSGLTEPSIIEQHLDKRRFIVETWEDESQAIELVNLGYKVILALKHYYYLDHGFWPSTEYHNWRTMYNKNIPNVVTPKLILGAETCMWSEYVDENGIDARIWPRSAAIAERLWANPSTSAQAAENRFLQHRERLVTLGIKADAVVPEWCYYHDGECVIFSY